MRRPLRLTAGLAALTALAACSPSEPAHDVAYYRDHPVDRAAELQACHNDRGRLAATPNCINALSAESAAASKRFWTVHAPAARVAQPGKL